VRSIFHLLIGLSLVAALPVFPGKALGGQPEPARPPSPGAPEPAAPKRAKVTCEQYRATAQAHAKHAIFNTKIKQGAWGNIPAPLRKLPPRARLCGADGIGQAVIASPLFGKDIEAHYAPLFTKIGFAPLDCKVVGRRTQCTCKRHRDIGIVVTDQDSEAFVIAVMKRS
jgi:hypothetical protein